MVQSQIVSLSDSDIPVGIRVFPVVSTLPPVITKVGDHTAIFRNHVLPVYDADSTERQSAVLIGDDISKLDERIAPVSCLKDIVDEVSEPGGLKVEQRFIIGITLGIDQLECPALDESVYLLDGSREMVIQFDVLVDVI